MHERRTPSSLQLAALFLIGLGGLMLLLNGWESNPVAVVRDGSVSLRKSASDSRSHTGPGVATRLPIDLASDASSSFIVLVVDHADLRPIAGATVTARTGSQAEEGKTDESGAFRVPASISASDYDVTAEVPGYESVRRRVKTGSNRSVRLLMHSRAVIRGRVQWSDPVLQAKEIRVVGWRSGEALPRLRTSKPYVDLNLPASNVSVDGLFELRGVDPNSTYTVAAGAPGWTCEELSRHTKPGDQAVSIQLVRVYASVVRLERPDHTAVRTDNPSTGMILTSFPYEGAESLDLRSAEARLAGIGLEAVQEDGDELMLAYTDKRGEVANGVTVRFDVPGYVATSARVPVLPVVEGRIARFRVVLEPEASGFGDVVVKFVGGAELPKGISAGGPPPGTLWLRPVGGSSRPLEVFVRDMGKPIHIPATPAGQYSLSLHASEGAFRSEGQSIAVPDGAHVAARVDIGQLGWVEVILVDESGRRMKNPGACRFRARAQGSEVPSSYFTFAKPPYVLQGLVPGHYGIEIASRRFLAIDHGPASAAVGSSRVETVRIRAKRKG